MASVRRSYLRSVGTLASAMIAGAFGGCSTSGLRPRSVPTVRVGSKPFAEQRILGYLAYERLQRIEGIEVVDEIEFRRPVESGSSTHRLRYSPSVPGRSHR
ncbi:hypothetical protein [Halapricum hydrolyticum]|uniref:Uncharacterized protein n=1 Tax=Halapricum hydrolyticum TaxID=2979991 RepID=A0AAE3LHW5_9EURY|nr:hypothetical protein [Halapricum hydrolyticum]MCU4719114.1 hypothetical protein [Halapricum hydrolyticum]MCU4727304.1 hypothetical protein [Halapricum hydrolyticum]